MKTSRFPTAGRRCGIAISATAVALASLCAEAATVVAPNELETVNGATQNSAGTGAPLNHNAAGTYQMIIDSSHLTALGANALISGLAFRLRGTESVDAPTTDIVFTDYEIRLGKASLSHGSLSGEPLDGNIHDEVLVRDGALTISAGSFESDGTPSPFGTTIAFSSSYSYTGGDDLVIEIRHTTGTGPVSSLLIDANLSLAAFGNSVGDTFAAYGGNAFNSTTGSLSSFTPVRLTYTVVPEPSEYAAAAGLGLVAFAAWRRSRRNANELAA